ncbi:Lrp/AsnC family transcriptional regulator [Tsuneonella rigui]|uniref:Lrp/AsnC family transcriptional regulator n=1 Tax=Tsuneonella rigui TaxID=1708790 RepID=UPI000F7E9B8B|nr:Lrp/AsnC family transcriptional regulator [Tsuneonella rigui]
MTAVAAEDNLLDLPNRRILRLLQRDGRITNQQLSEQIGLSPAATHDRLRKLRNSGLILSIEARLDPKRLGLGLLVFLQVQMERSAGDLLDAFGHGVQGKAEILECHMVTGSFDFLLKVRVRDMDDFRQFLGNLLDDIPGIRETHTYAVMQEVKSITALEL